MLTFEKLKPCPGTGQDIMTFITQNIVYFEKRKKDKWK